MARWLYERLGLASFTYHVPAYANSLPYLLGGITLVGILVVGASGIYLAQFYHPDPLEAHASTFFIIKEVPLGDFVRGVHFWASNLVMVTLFLHVLRVFMGRAFKAPREALWLVGIGLLVLMIGLFFTGTVLKWDQEAFEALEHNEAMARLLGGLGAWFTGEFTTAIPLLSRVYVAHVGILPALLLFLVAGHQLLIRIHGIAPRPGKEAEDRAALAAAEEGEAVAAVSHFDVHLRRLMGFGLLATALYALFLPFLGALLDHHFAERQPGHLHIYPGGVPVEHPHPYEATHAHGEIGDASDGLKSSEGGIIFLPSDEEGAPGPNGLGLAAAVLGMLIVLFIPPTLKRLLPQDRKAFSHFTPLQEPPPPRLAR